MNRREALREWRFAQLALNQPGFGIRPRNSETAVAYAKQISALDQEMGDWFKRAGAPELEAWRGTTKQNLTKYSR